MLRRRCVVLGLLTLLVPLSSGGTPTGHAAAASGAAALSPTLSTTDRLDDRRFLASGERAYEVGTEAGRYPAMGFHTRGEMGGIWSPPIKLLDGIWFGVDGSWVSPATSFSSGYGYVQMTLPGARKISLRRTDVIPDGRRALLVGLDVTDNGPGAANFTLTVDAHSELMSAYPWGQTTPDQTTFNLPDTASAAGGALVFRDQGTPGYGEPPHDWAAVVGAAPSAPLRLQKTETGKDFRGPQDPPVICPTSQSGAAQPPRCDDTAYGRGAGGELRYKVKTSAGTTQRLWFVVAGSDQGLPAAQQEFAAAAANPDAELAAKVAARQTLAGDTKLSLPGDPLLAQAIDWSKQNLADLVQSADNLRVRETNAGTIYPPPVGVVPRIRFIGAGFPDYPWMFATDGEYTAFASVGLGQFSPIEDHLRSLRDVSDLLNARSGKVVHETVTTGDVYFGANADPGNTDETVKFPSTVALIWRWTGDNSFRDEMYDFSVRNLRYVVTHLDADGDGWPEGGGNVENPGQGQEKLDSAVYLIRGLRDLAEMATSKGDAATAAWATTHADQLTAKFEHDWWDGAEAPAYADSLMDPGNKKLMQRYWTGVTPMEAELWASGHTVPGLAEMAHAIRALALRETSCYTGPSGLYEDGQGATTAMHTPPQPTTSCDGDHAVSSAPDEKDVFTLNTAVMAVGEGNYGRLAQQRRYLDDNAVAQLPSPDEMPGAMPEIRPSPPHPPYYGNSLDRLFTERAQVMQAWGNYGTVWPVVHQQLGISPDLGMGRLEVVPQVPPYERQLSGSNIRIGGGSIDVNPSVQGDTYETEVSLHGVSSDLVVGVTLPDGTAVRSATLNGHPVATTVRHTNRGEEVLADAGALRTAELVVVTA